MRRSVALVAALAVVLTASGGEAFTQSGLYGGPTPAGHEYLTVASAYLLRAKYPELEVPEQTLLAANAAALAKLQSLAVADFQLPGGWKSDLKVEAASLASMYDRKWVSFPAFSAALGQRFVDNMGFDMPRFGHVTTACLDAVAVLPSARMPDHFMRRDEDAGEGGRLAAHAEAVARLKRYFAEAVAADEKLVPVTDAEATQRSFLVMRAYYLFGRALHLLQDSFSTEHARRGADHKVLVDLKHHGCLPGVPQHANAFPHWPLYAVHGDIIWSSYSINDLKPEALAALSASQELWEAFLVARKNRAQAAAILQPVIDRWLTLAPPAPGSPGAAPAFCKSGGRELTADDVKAAAAARRTTAASCLDKTGRSKRDPEAPPYYWRWEDPALGAKVDAAFWSAP